MQIESLLYLRATLDILSMTTLPEVQIPWSGISLYHLHFVHLLWYNIKIFWLFTNTLEHKVNYSKNQSVGGQKWYTYILPFDIYSLGNIDILIYLGHSINLSLSTGISEELILAERKILKPPFLSPCGERLRHLH